MHPVRRALAAAGAVVAVPLAAVGTLAFQARRARTNGVFIPEVDLGLNGRIGGPGPALHMVWLGDSTAAGIGADHAHDTVARRVARALERPVDLTVLGWSGAQVADVLAEQIPQLPTDVDMIVISVGANNVTHLTRPSQFRRTYEAVLDALPNDTIVVVLGCPDFSTSPRLAQPLRAVAGWYSSVLDKVVHAIADERSLPFVNIHGDPHDEFHRNPPAYFAEDRFHPSSDGYRLWAEAVTPVVRAALAGVDRENAADTTGPSG